MSCKDCPSLITGAIGVIQSVVGIGIASEKTISLRQHVFCSPCTEKTGQSGPIGDRTCPACECNVGHKTRLKRSACPYGWFNAEVDK